MFCKFEGNSLTLEQDQFPFPLHSMAGSNPLLKLTSAAAIKNILCSTLKKMPASSQTEVVFFSPRYVTVSILIRDFISLTLREKSLCVTALGTHRDSTQAVAELVEPTSTSHCDLRYS